MGGFAIGSSIWSVNFFGLLAYCLPTTMNVNSQALISSFLASMGLAALCLYGVSRQKNSAQHLAIGLALATALLFLIFKAGTLALNLDEEQRHQYPFLSVFITVNLSIVLPLIVTAQFHSFFSTQPSANKRAFAIYSLWPMLLAATVFICLHMVGSAFTRLWDHPSHSHAAIMASLQIASILSVIAIAIIVSTWFLAKYDQLNIKAAQLLKSLNRSKQDLQLMMMHDPLTRLPNRALLEDRLDKILARSKRCKSQFAVISVDLDRFKTINNTVGHAIGDELIKQVAKRLHQSVRAMDTIARIGGDEFLVAIDDGINRDQVTQIADRMINTACKVFFVQGNEIRISLSIGISLYPQDGHTIRDLIINADTAMYFSKKMGRNNFHFFDPCMKTVTEQKKKMEKRLRIALEEGLFTLAYQPKINITNNTVCGVEALLRWDDPELGTVTPDEFIPLSEEIGLILPLGLWVLNSACQQIKQWLDEGLCSLPVAVNISPYQLNQTGFSHLVEQALQQSGIPPNTSNWKLPKVP
ncbi:hypothetical protein BST96_04870 [Oceanicoccus sagamiensis]|uniref:GGDEF-domain containing protein n=1 Tax=Oceanicoccus sagamiensis TaxID=716816 RepID=A0A1X9NEY8_9GAMM|nr:hypothetical protein BST96_04870 [Oceanicoccus sagamiensis]